MQSPVRPTPLAPDDRRHDLGLAWHPRVLQQAIHHLLEGWRLPGEAVENLRVEAVRFEGAYIQKSGQVGQRRAY